MLEIKQLTKEYQNTRSNVLVLEDINLVVGESEFISIVGPSGCGKSTLLKLISGLEKPTTGEILFRGSKINISTKVGFIFQNYSLFPWLTVYENIAFGLRLEKVPQEKIDSIVKRYLLVTGLDHFKHVYPKSLSGGMQQRVAIARTLATNPDIILMDEPFGALDVQTRSQMQEFLLKILKDTKKTVIMVTHDVEEALYLSDKIVILTTKPGSIKEVVNVPFSRPRRPELRQQEQFTQLENSLSYTLKSESIKSTTDKKKIIHEPGKLIIGSNIWTGIAPLYLAQEKGLFKKQGMSTEIVTLEWSDDRLQPLRDGVVDALYTTLDSALLEMKTNPEVSIYMPLDVSYGGDALVTNGTIQTVAELKGKTIGVEKGWVSQFFLSYVLKGVGLTLEDVVLKDIRASDIGRELVAGNIDAASIQEPWLSKTKEYGSITVLKDTRDYKPLIYAVLLVRNDILQSRKNDFVKFRQAWFKAVTLFSQEPVESAMTVAPYLGLSEIELFEQLENIVFAKPNEDITKAIFETKEILGIQ